MENKMSVIIRSLVDARTFVTNYLIDIPYEKHEAMANAIRQITPDGEEPTAETINESLTVIGEDPTDYCYGA